MQPKQPKHSLTPQLDPKKQRNLLLIQNQSKLTTLRQQIKNISNELTDTKDAMRKYRQGSIPELVLSSDITWQNNGASVYVLNSGNFYHELPITKLVQYFEGRADMLTKSRKKKESQIKKILDIFVEWLKNKKIGAADLSIEVRELVKDYMQELEDNEDN